MSPAKKDAIPMACLVWEAGGKWKVKRLLGVC